MGLGKALGLDRYTERQYFGERLQILSGVFQNLAVELEISSGEWHPYLRITVEFPRALAQDLKVFSEERSGLIGNVRNLHEFEIGEEEFDDRFVLFAHERERLELMLPESTRYQMLRIIEDADELRLTDNALFLFVDHPCERVETKTMFKKAIELGQRLYKTARLLGPRTPEKGAGHYEQATIEQAIRTSSVSEAEESSG